MAPTQAAPSSSDWAPPYTSSGSADPADQRPRIDPDASNSFSSLRLPSTPAAYNTWNRANPYGSNVKRIRRLEQSIRRTEIRVRGRVLTSRNGRVERAASETFPEHGVAGAPFDLRPLPNYDRQSEAAGQSVAPST